MSVQRPPFVPFAVPTHGTRIAKYFVFHTTEGTGTVESLAAFFRGDGGLGVNFITQPNGRMGSNGNMHSETWHVVAHNGECIGCEQIGFSSTSRIAWFKRLRQLWAAAWVAAWASEILGIPLVYVGLGHGNRLRTFQGVGSGFLEHRDVPDNDHGDCGSGYPLGFVLSCALKWKASKRGVPWFVRMALPKK